MSRFSGMGFIVLAVIGVVAFFSPFDANGAIVEVRPGAPVTVMNTPLPVRDAELQEIIRAGISVGDGAKRDDFTVVLTLGQNSGIAGANIVLPSPAIVETLAALCSPQILVDVIEGSVGNGVLTLQTPGPGPNQIAAELPSGVSNAVTLNPGLSGNWPLSPFPNGTWQFFMPPTAVGYPVGTKFTLYTSTPPGMYTCSISVVVRYTK